MNDIKAILFDLDGTFLPMDQDLFVKSYFKLLAVKLAPYGYEPKQLIDAIWSGTAAMVKNDGTCRNEDAFWKLFTGIYGNQALEHLPVFEDFYANEFQQVQSVCGYNPQAAEVIALVKEKGFRTALATNPIVPAIATASRIRWAGLSHTDFELYTTYENSRFCKPNLDYYRDILSQMDLRPEECVMVGNDVSEDMVARKLGMQVFLLTDCLLNKHNEDISQFPHGGYPELLEYIRAL